tara:strand:- start:603 stop:1943 length:1341 start_codon:yes stop_codon:yes gene_type:complete
MDNKKTENPKPDGADAILNRQHLIDDDHLPALVERFVVSVFVFTLNFLYTLIISIFRPIKLSKHFLREHNDKLVLSSPVTYITVTVFITEVLMVELTRLDSNNQIKDVVIGSTNQFFTDVLFQFLPKIVFVFFVLVVLSNLGEKLCKQPKANLFRLICYFYGSLMIFVRLVHQLISELELNYQIFGVSIHSQFYVNILESIRHPFRTDGELVRHIYFQLGWVEFYIIIAFFMAVIIGNGITIATFKQPVKWLKFLMYIAILIMSYVTMKTLGTFYYGMTVEGEQTVYCRGGNSNPIRGGFKINTVITNSGTSKLYISGNATGVMRVVNSLNKEGKLVPRIVFETQKQPWDDISNPTDLITLAELKTNMSKEAKQRKEYDGIKFINMRLNDGNVTVIGPKSSLGITLNYEGDDYTKYNYVEHVRFSEMLNSSVVECFSDKYVIDINQ